jgi:hypothetical protein
MEIQLRYYFRYTPAEVEALSDDAFFAEFAKLQWVRKKEALSNPFLVFSQ